MIQTLQFWVRCIESNHTECFSNLHNFLIENQLKLDQNTKTNIIVHLKGLSATFREYFPVLSDSNNWIRNPFDESTIFSSQGLCTKDTEKLIEISSDYELKLRFKSLSLITFWLSVRKEYPLLAGKATTTLLPFSTTYLCEKSISFLRKSENQAQKQTQCRTGFKTSSFFVVTGLPSTVPIKTSASFILKSSFKTLQATTDFIVICN
jgi:hypothetical protein